MKKLFIHIPKSAGMTIRKSDILKDYIIHAEDTSILNEYYKENLISEMKKNNEYPNFGHARWRDILKEVTDNYTAFAVIRNPWDRVVSRYFFAKKLVEIEKKDPIGKYKLDSFEAFLEERFEYGTKEFMWHKAVRGWYPSYDYVTDINGNLKCDILRFNYINDDLCLYFNINQMSKARNVTNINKKTYKDIYNKSTIQIVADWYKKDIDYWGFDFDSGPTKNYWSKT